MAISDELRKLVDPNNECCCEHCLSNKCKEWAMQQYPSYIIDSGIGKDLNFQAKTEMEIKTALRGIVQGLYGYSEIVLKNKKFTSNSEPEAVFKATSYIIEQLKQKD